MRHGTRTHLAGLKPLGDQLMPGHQPDGGRQIRGPRGDLSQRADHIKVERAWIHLASAHQNVCEAQMISDPPLELLQLAGVAAQQIQHVLARPHRTLDAT